jgi:hypothetical protein
MTGRPSRAAALGFWAIALAAPAAAQSLSTTAVAVSFGSTYDSNIFWRAQEESDRVWTISPTLRVQRDTPRSRWFTDAATDAAWYTYHPDLNTLAQRQHVDTRAEWQASPVSYLRGIAGYATSVNPAEINVATGLHLGRVRAWRWSLGPEYSHRVLSRTTLTAGYQMRNEIIATASDILTHAAEIRVEQEIGERDVFHAKYIPEQFRFEFGGDLASQRFLAGWSRRMSPSSDIVAAGGVRLAEDRVWPEIDVSISRRFDMLTTSAAYVWTQSTSLGVSRLVDIQRLDGAIAIEGRRMGLSLQGSAFFNDLQVRKINVFSGAFAARRALFGPVWLEATYTHDYQGSTVLADLRPADQALLLQAIAKFRGEMMPFTPPTERLRRSAFAVQILVTGETRRAAREPQEPEPGRGRPGRNKP